MDLQRGTITRWHLGRTSFKRLEGTGQGGENITRGHVEKKTVVLFSKLTVVLKKEGRTSLQLCYLKLSFPHLFS